MSLEEESQSNSPQTDRFLFWGAFLLLLAACFLIYSSVQDEEARLAGLRKIEADREAELAAAEKARDQSARFMDRFSGDPEFVRDQARERLGVASPEEVVIRVESTPGAAPSASPRTSPPLFAPASQPADEASR